MNHKLSLVALCCAPLLVNAAEEAAPEAYTLKAAAKLGMLVTSGDTEKRSLDSGLDISYERGQWRSSLQFGLLIDKTETEDTLTTTAQKLTIVSQTDYTIEKDGKNYVYANVAHENNRFSSYDVQNSISAGWGRRWLETENYTLDADIGPGYKSDKNLDGSTADSLIVQASANYFHQLNDNVDFKQSLVARQATDSDENSTYKAITSIGTKLMDALQVSLNYTLDHNTEVAEGNSKTNTQTSVTLVYNF